MSSNDSGHLVSIIMNCLNCEKYLRDALNSVYAQTYRNWEIIFWDNASTDGSAEIARNYDHRLRYFKGEETIPVGAARNKALEQVRGEYIAFLDCDDLWLPEKLEKQIPLFEDPEVGLVFCDTIFFNDNNYEERLFSRRKYVTGKCFSALLMDNFLAMPSVVIRRLALDDQSEWFDPRFSLNEEADLFIRIAYKWHLAMVNEPLAKWRIHPGSLTWHKFSGFADELGDMLKKYKRIYPNFVQRFAKEIRIFERRLAVIRAKDAIASDNLPLARNCLVPYMFSNLKASMLYLITYLPKNKALSLINKFSIMKLNPHQY
jgi:glycosyltransferase involved in cell wall biosynthesis